MPSIIPEADNHSPNLPMVIYHAPGVGHIRRNISRDPSWGFIGVRTHVSLGVIMEPQCQRPIFTRPATRWSYIMPYIIPEAVYHSPNLPMVIYHAPGVSRIRGNISRNPS